MNDVPAGSTSPGPVVALATARLRLIPATPALTRAAIEDPARLARDLGALLPASWPHEHLDAPALEYLSARVSEPGHAGWWLYFMVLEDGVTERTLIGTAGYKGPPADDGTVEVGYGVVHDQQRRGYASEAVRGLLARAFGVPAVTRIIAETLPELTASIGVLRKCGFRLIGDGSEPGVIRFAMSRAAYQPDGERR